MGKSGFLHTYFGMMRDKAGQSGTGGGNGDLRNYFGLWWRVKGIEIEPAGRRYGIYMRIYLICMRINVGARRLESGALCGSGSVVGSVPIVVRVDESGFLYRC